MAAANTTVATTHEKSEMPVLGLLTRYQKTIEASLPKHLRPERMMKVIVSAINKTPDLLKCQPMTVINSIIHLSQLGLEPRPGEAYLIPFKKNFKNENGQWDHRYECVPIIDYRGKAKLARQSGLVDDIVADVVYSRDKFHYEVTQDGILFEHKPLKFRTADDGEMIEVAPEDRGKMIGSWAIAFLKGAKPHVVFLTRSEIRAIRDKSKAKDNGPWEEDKNGNPVNVNDWNEQAKKTAVHRLCKMIPQSPELAMANDLDDRVDTGAPLDNLISVEVMEPGLIAAGDSPETLKDRVKAKTSEMPKRGTPPIVDELPVISPDIPADSTVYLETNEGRVLYELNESKTSWRVKAR